MGIHVYESVSQELRVGRSAGRKTKMSCKWSGVGGPAILPVIVREAKSDGVLWMFS